MRLISVERMRQLEQKANASGYSYRMMMENAAKGIADTVAHRFEPTSGPILGVVGGGNNGGDTLLALVELQKKGWKTYASLVKDRDPANSELNDYLHCGGQLVTLAELLRLSKKIRFSIILDGALGTGFKPPITDQLNQCLLDIRAMAPAAKWVAVDCPSGTDCTNGNVSPGTPFADLTICLEAVKDGLLMQPAFSYCGEIKVVDLGLEESQEESKNVISLAGTDEIRQLLPERSQFSHKGSFGKTLIIGGSTQFCGAPILACKGAYAVGAGLVTAAVPNNVYSLMAGANPDITWFPLVGWGVKSMNALILNLLRMAEKYEAIVIGPGFGTSVSAAKLVEKLLLDQEFPITIRHSENRKVQYPIVIDADALNILALRKGWEKSVSRGNILTPHPGEMARLTGLTIEEIQSNRTKIAARYSEKWEQIIVLKGPLTVIADPGGSITIIPIASSALAKGGSGDLLAGMIGGYLAQGLQAKSACILAAWVHAQAGVFSAGEVGAEDSVSNFDLLRAIPKVLQGFRDRKNPR